MHTRLALTTAAQPLGGLQAACLFEVKTGIRAGRRVAVFLSSPTTLNCSWSDGPYVNWSTPAAIWSSVDGDAGFSAAMDSDNNIHLAFIEQSSMNVMHNCLTFTETGWQPGVPVTVFAGDINSSPSLAIDSSDCLWLGWVRLTDPPVRHIHVKSSSDAGATWGAGAGDSGEMIHSGGMLATVKLLAGPSRLHAVYYYASDYLCHRSCPLPSGSWTDPVTIVSGAECSSMFDCALRTDGNPSAAWAAAALYYREFDGAHWGPAVTIPESGATGIQLTMAGPEPIITFVRSIDVGHAQPYLLRRQNGVFSEAALLDARVGEFDRVFCYHGATASFADVTSAARSVQSGDMVHPQSSALLGGPGDAVFFAAGRPFRYVWLTLSTPGAGGTVSVSYWDGASWRGVVPYSGPPALDVSELDLWVWPDYASLPADWQKSAVNGVAGFWIKLEVVSPYTTAPVGTRANMVSGIEAMRAGR